MAADTRPPVIETVTEVRTVCPPEVTAALPARVATPDDLSLDLADRALGWLAAHLDREQLLEARIVDAKGQCPHG